MDSLIVVVAAVDNFLLWQVHNFVVVAAADRLGEQAEELED